MKTKEQKTREVREILKISLPLTRVLKELFEVRQEDKFYYCPFHPITSRATLRITPNGYGYNCFHCGSHGTVLDLLYNTSKASIVKSLPFIQDYGEFSLSVFNYFNLVLPFKHMNTEYGMDETLLDTVNLLLKKAEDLKVDTAEDTVVIGAKRQIRRYKTGKMSAEELVDYFLSLQSEEDTYKEIVNSFAGIEDLQDLINMPFEEWEASL